jgi:hypothetical protein
MLAKRTVIVRIALLIIALGLVSGCNRARASNAGAQDSQGASSASTRDSQGKNSSAVMMAALNGEASGPDRCALLTDDEIREAIGPHAAGVNAPGNGWGLQSCRWIATNGKKDAADSDLIVASDWIEVGVFNPGGIGENASWARQQAEGEPENGFVEGARYDLSSGTLWFDCVHDRFCAVQAHIASPEPRRRRVARQLAELVEKRLR